MTQLPYVTALVLGSLHAFEPDHVAAVTSFAAQKPEPRAAVRYGFNWAVGHGGSVIVVGTALILFGLVVPAATSNALERMVGVTLIALGAWACFHSHNSKTHNHAHGATFIGLLHGLAGAAPAVALTQLVFAHSALNGVGFLLTFALGTAATMCLYAAAAGFLVGRAWQTAALGRLVGRLTGLGTMVIGVIWLIR